MNRTFLKTLGLEAEVIEQIMAEYGKNVEGLNAKIETLTSENDKTKESLKAFDEKLKTDSENLKNQYEEKIREMTLDGAIDKALIKSNAKHKSLLVGRFDKTKLTIDEDGKINGLDEQLQGIKEKYADLFTPVVEGASPNNPDNNNQAGFDFGFTSVREN